VGKWINTSVSHNYGLYFTVWDRLMGTMNTNYDKAFEEMASRTKFKNPETVRLEI